MACLSIATSAAAPLLSRRSAAPRRAVAVARSTRTTASIAPADVSEGAHAYDATPAATAAAAAAPRVVSRRAAALTVPALALALGLGGSSSNAAYADEGEAAPAVKIIEDTAGFGAKIAKRGDLVLVNYYATTTVDGNPKKMFDSTLGGEIFFTSGNNKSIDPAAARPVIIKLSGDPVPGLCKGLKQGIEGMRVGGKRTITVPPELGFGGSSVRSPYTTVPGSSTLTYEVTLLRLSDTGPDALYKDIAGCGLGGANTLTQGCASIVPVE